MRHDSARGEWRDGDTRYLLIRSDSLMGMFRHLDGPSREAVMEALRASVMEHGGRSAALYAAEHRDALLAAVALKALELGWGVWDFSSDESALHLRVKNSPFAAGHGAAVSPVCAPIAGMLQAVASITLGAPALAEELGCAACGASACAFRAWRER